MIEVNSIVINYTTYQDNEVIEEVDLAFVPWKNDSMDYAFQNSSLLYSVNNFNNSVVSARHTFDNCSNLQNTPTIPNSVTDVSYMFANCRNMINMYNFSVNRRNVINAQGMFENCPKITYANFFTFDNVKDISKAYKNCPSLYYFYGIHRLQNVENMDELFMDTKINGYHHDYQNISSLPKLQSMRNIFYNCTNMYYTTNISNCPNLIDMSGAFYGCKNIGNSYISECNSVENMAYSYYECYNMNYISEIPQNVINMYMTFRNCRNLSNIPTIPNNVVDMSGTFCDCNRIINAPEIPSSVINIVSEDGVGIFQHCDNMSGIVKIGSSEIENAVNTFRGTTLQKSLLIPFKYENGQYTKTYNAFNTAGYSPAYRTEDGVMMFDIDTDPELLTWRFEVVDNKSILYEYLGSENIISVPNNNTMINCFNMHAGDFYNQPNVPFFANSFFNTVDLNNAQFVNDNMSYAFYNCYNLKNVTNINENVTSMESTFYYCNRIINAPEIPNSVIDMIGTFSHCYNLENAPEIPSSVIDMSGTFNYCYNLRNAPEIPNSVTRMDSTFYNCYNLINAPVIPNSVIDMSRTFMYCTNLDNVPVIPNSVTNMYETFCYCSNLVNAPNLSNCTNLVNLVNTFYYCYNLVNAPNLSGCTNLENMYYTFWYCRNLVNAPDLSGCSNLTIMYYAFGECYNLVNAPVIPNNVNDMRYAFYECYNLTGDMMILSENVYNAYRCFYGTSLSKNVYIPFTYENGVNTATYNIFKSYYGSGQNGVILKNARISDWRYEYINNGARLLQEYTGTNTSIIVPNVFTIINNYNSSYQTDMPFYNNQNLISVDLRETNFVNNDMSFAFYNSSSIEEVDGIFSVENMAYAFQNCVNLKNVYITSESVYNVEGIFDNTDDTEKNVYIPLLDILGGETITYQVFKDAGYSTTVRKNGVLLKDISSVDIDLSDYDYNADDNNNVEIRRYIGNEEIINTPNV